MRIRKLLIKNFKNLKDNVVINFEQDISLLVGPNGFGKTTIFDAIELALTGGIYRISNAKIIDNRSTFSKAYFHNDVRQDVIIKMLICNDKREELTIVRLYEKKTRKKDRAMSPENSLANFKLYKDNSGNFFNVSDTQEFEEINQIEINKFIGFYDDNYKIENLFYLFNYIQQDNTDYYFRRSESSRKDMLSFLLNLESYQNKLKNINEMKNKIKNVLDNLNNQKKGYIQSNHVENNSFKSLPLSQKKKFKFNIEEIMFDKELSMESLNRYLKEVDDLIEFNENFSPIEFRKKRQSTKAEREIVNNDELLNYLMFKEIIEDRKVYYTVVNNHKIISTKKNYSNYLLKNFKGKIEFLESQNRLKNRFLEIRILLTKDVENINIEKTLQIITEEKVDEILLKDFTELHQSLVRYRELKNNLKSSNKSYNEIVSLRNKLQKHKLPNDEHHEQCVLCGYEWGNSFVLQRQYDEIGKTIQDNMSSMERIVSDLLQIIDIGIQKIVNKLVEEEKRLILVSPEIIQDIWTLDSSPGNMEFEKFVNQNTSFEPLEFSTLNSNEYKQLDEEFKKEMQKFFLLLPDLYRKLTYCEKNKNDFDTILQAYSMIDKFFLNNHFLSIQSLPQSMSEFKIRKQELKIELEGKLLDIRYDSVKSSDPYNMYENFFDNQEVLFNLCTKEELEMKKKYIKFKFEQKRSYKLEIIENRLTVIQNTYDHLERRSVKMDKDQKEYQTDMIHMLKIPFFIYTAKILQNYQQGMGVLLTTHQGNSNVRFLTSSTSEQDAMYQLSSGQITVISFAFTLALNKTFKISEGLNLLAIDDPIQDMDSMNVYALIDLLRHSLPNYQIIMSTHSDSSAMFIKYKFDLMSEVNEEKVSLKDIKTLFIEGNTN